MKKEIKTFLKNYSDTVTQETIDIFTSISKYKKKSKGEIIVRYGTPTSKFFILENGIVGNFIKKETCNNKQVIRTLYTSGKPFGAISNLTQKSKKSSASYICLTDCEILETDFNKFLELKKNNANLAFLYNKFLEEVFLRSERKIDELCLMSSTQRYLKLLEDIPNICNILPQYQIAYYLNITPVQLSRIRKKLLVTQY